MIMVLFAMLPQVLEAKFSTPVLDLEGHQLKTRLQGTVWEPGCLASYPGLLQPSDIVYHMQDLQRDSLTSSLCRPSRHGLSATASVLRILGPHPSRRSTAPTSFSLPVSLGRGTPATLQRALII